VLDDALSDLEIVFITDALSLMEALANAGVETVGGFKEKPAEGIFRLVHQFGLISTFFLFFFFHRI
jgi:hypothetical protein